MYDLLYDISICLSSENIQNLYKKGVRQRANTEGHCFFMWSSQFFIKLNKLGAKSGYALAILSVEV